MREREREREDHVILNISKHKVKKFICKLYKYNMSLNDYALCCTPTTFPSKHPERILRIFNYSQPTYYLKKLNLKILI